MTTLPLAITPTPPTSIKLEPNKQGKFSFTVTSLAAPDRVLDVILQALVVSEDGMEKEADWLTVEPQATLTLSGGKTETVVITVLQKPITPIGKSTIKLKVADKSIPNDSFTDSPLVICEVLGEPKPIDKGKRLPKWLIPVIVAGVIVLAGGGVLAWKLMQPLPLLKLREDALAPAGAIIAYGGSTPPPGWLLCNGSAVDRLTHGNLFAAIGISWGGGDGTTTFNLPDLRGRFLRGVDGGTGRDPDAGSRTAPAPLGNTGNTVGSVQADQFQGHSHVHEIPNNAISNPLGTFFGVNGTNTYGSGRVQAPAALSPFGSVRFGTETRPINAYVVYIIKD